jgi:hypothetical protein
LEGVAARAGSARKPVAAAPAAATAPAKKARRPSVGPGVQH